MAFVVVKSSLLSLEEEEQEQVAETTLLMRTEAAELVAWRLSTKVGSVLDFVVALDR